MEEILSTNLNFGNKIATQKEIFLLFLGKGLILGLKCRDFRKKPKKSQKAKPHNFRPGPSEKSQIRGVWLKKSQIGHPGLQCCGLPL